MAETSNAVTIQVVDNTVTVQVEGAFLADIQAKGGVKLWPEKQATTQGVGLAPPPQYWMFTFGSAAEAAKFAADAKALSDAAQGIPATPVVASEVP